MEASGKYRATIGADRGGNVNQYGSYRKFLDNSKQAMLAAIEIYNKPQFDYREEVFSILLVNAWELLLLAMLSKNRQRIFQPKKREKDYQTWMFSESIGKVKPYFPANMDYQAVAENLRLIREYRNKVVHYYNHEEIAHCIYVLAQAAIKNYRDLVKAIFEQDIVNQINLVLLPLSFNAPPDFVEFFKGVQNENRSPFAKELFRVMEKFEETSSDTSRLVTQCVIKLESTKKIELADINAGVGGSQTPNTMLIHKNMNPDDSHPFFRKDIIGMKKNGEIVQDKHAKLKKYITSYEFYAIIWKYEIKTNPEYCWNSTKGGSPRYSQKVITLLNELTDVDLEHAKKEYKSTNETKASACQR